MGLIAAAVLAGLFVLSWPVVVLLHELGHALVSRAVGARAVTIYVGSYGDQAASWQLRLPGRIILWLKWGLGGLCDASWPPERPLGTARRAAILVAGPVASTLVAWAMLWPAFHYDGHGALKLLLVVFGAASLLDLLINLLPLRHRVKLSRGGYTYSDGYQLYRLLARKLFNSKSEEESSLHTATELFNAGDYAASAPLLHQLLAYYHDSSFYQLAFSAYYNSQQFAAALALADAYPAFAATFEDHATIRAYLLCRTDQLDEAAALYTKLLPDIPVEQHVLLRSNRGYSHLLASRYEAARHDFDAVLVLEPDNAYAHAQRGRLRLEQGDPTGLDDLYRAQELNPQEPFAYCNLGLHAHAEGRYTEALAYLEQASALDPHLHRLPAYLAATRACLESAAVVS